MSHSDRQHEIAPCPLRAGASVQPPCDDGNKQRDDASAPDVNTLVTALQREGRLVFHRVGAPSVTDTPEQAPDR